MYLKLHTVFPSITSFQQGFTISKSQPTHALKPLSHLLTRPRIFVPWPSSHPQPCFKTTTSSPHTQLRPHFPSPLSAPPLHFTFSQNDYTHTSTTRIPPCAISSLEPVSYAPPLLSFIRPPPAFARPLKPSSGSN